MDYLLDRRTTECQIGKEIFNLPVCWGNTAFAANQLRKRFALIGGGFRLDDQLIAEHEDVAIPAGPGKLEFTDYEEISCEREDMELLGRAVMKLFREALQREKRQKAVPPPNAEGRGSGPDVL